MPTRFVIICAPRTGSTMLRLMLNSHPRICCHGEVFSLKRIAGFEGLKCKNQEKINDLAEMRYKDPISFLYEFIYNIPNVRACGCKIKYRQLEEKWEALFNKILADKNILIIHLLRKNLLKRHISQLIAVKTRTNVILKDPTKRKKMVFNKILVKPRKCIEDIIAVKSAEKRFRKYFKDHKVFEVVYEDIVERENTKMNEMLAFLGVDIVPLKPQTIKINPELLEDIVENYVELSNALNNTPFSEFLE